MRQLRLPGLSCVTPFVTLRRNTSGYFRFSLASAGKSPRQRQGFVQPVAPSASGICSQGGLWFSQVPCEPFLTFAVLLDSGRFLAPDPLYSARTWSPQNATSRTPDDDMSFVALSHGLSHGCLRFVPPSRTTTRNSLPAADRPFRVGFFMPTEFVRRVSSLSRFPSPKADLGAMHSAFSG